MISLAMLFSLLAVASWANPVVNITDPHLYEYIRERLDRPSGPIYASDVLVISEIRLPDSAVASISGLEHFSKLNVLDLEDNRVSDLSPLARLSQLTELNLRNNQVQDISALTAVTSLRDLDLRGNNIEDIAALTRLTSLETLNLRENRVTDLQPLKHLTRLQYLNLHSNENAAGVEHLSDLVNLETLILRDVAIGDKLHIIENMSRLKKINLRNTGITQTSSLAALMAHGALQDHPQLGIQAEVNLLENKGLAEPHQNPSAPIRPYWDNITHKYPTHLPYAVSSVGLPVFSHESGFHQQAFWLEITHDDPNAVIYYTLDGSDPDDHAIQYEGPIWIDDRSDDVNDLSMIQTAEDDDWKEPEGTVFKGHVIKAIAVDDNNRQSNISTKSYFIHELGHERYSLPVIALSIDQDKLFDDDSGIYRIPHALERGMKQERQGHIEFFDADGSFGFSQNVGVRIHGGITRKYRQKSLRLYASHWYDEKDHFNYELFPDLKKSGSDEVLDQFKTLILRNSGNDWASTMLRDAFMQSIVSDINVFETQGHQPAILFINGEYWGIHGIRERYDINYFINHFDQPAETFAILTGSGNLKEGMQQDRQDYLDMRTFIADHDMSLDEHYEYIASQMCIDSFIQYFSANIYFGNGDWPQNNIDYWRVRPEFVSDDHELFDGRWRWLLYDTDFGFARFGEWKGSYYDVFKEKYGPTGGVVFNTLAWAADPVNHRSGSTWPNIIMSNLIENEAFRNEFINYMADSLNSRFKPSRVIRHLDEKASLIQDEIEEHIYRWNTMHLSEMRWRRNINSMRQYARSRPEHVFEHYTLFFELPGTAEVILKTNQQKGLIKINSLRIEAGTLGVDTPAAWTGTYFQDVPITLQAIPKEGYRFIGWEEEGHSASEVEYDRTHDTITLLLDGDTELRAVFERVDD